MNSIGWSWLTSTATTTLSVSEVVVIPPFQLLNVTDFVVQIVESNGGAATIRIYGSNGDVTAPDTLPTFPTSGGKNWSQINLDADGAVNANASKLIFLPRNVRYVTIRGLRSGSTDAKVDCVTAWRTS